MDATHHGVVRHAQMSQSSRTELWNMTLKPSQPQYINDTATSHSEQHRNSTSTDFASNHLDTPKFPHQSIHAHPHPIIEPAVAPWSPKPSKPSSSPASPAAFSFSSSWDGSFISLHLAQLCSPQGLAQVEAWADGSCSDFAYLEPDTDGEVYRQLNVRADIRWRKG